VDLRKLSIFSRVAELGSIQAAATELHIAQPAVSIAVQKLEQELGVQLFNRMGRGIRISSEGQAALQQVQVILAQVSELEQSIGDRQQLLSGELNLSCPAMLATYFLPKPLGQFLNLHPQLRANINQAGTQNIRQQLLKGELDLGIVNLDEDSDHSALELAPLLKEQVVLCTPDRHKWAEKKSISLAQLHGSPMVLYEQGYYLREHFNQLCEAQNVVPDVRLQTNFLPLLIRSVKEGMGTTIGLKMMATQESGLTGIAFRPRQYLKMALAKRKGQALSLANQAFFDWVKEHAKEF